MTSRQKTDEFGKLLNGFAEEPSAAEAGVPPAEPAPAETGPAEPPVVDKAALYGAYLTEEGYRFRPDDDGDLSVRIQGQWFCLFASDSDPNYFRLALPNLWECDDEDETAVALSLANDMNRRYKVAKFTLLDNRVWCGVEMFLAPLESFRATFERCSDLLCEGSGEFQRRMRTTAPPLAPPAGESQ